MCEGWDTAWVGVGVVGGVSWVWFTWRSLVLMKAVLLWLTALLGAPILVLCTPTSLRLQRFHLLCCSQVTEARAPPDSQRAHSGAWVSVTVLPPPSTKKESKSKEDDPKSGCQAQRDSPLLVGKARLQWPCFRLQAGPFPWPLHCFAAIAASLNPSTLSGFSLTFAMATPPLARNMFWVDLVCLLWQKGSESASAASPPCPMPPRFPTHLCSFNALSAWMFFGFLNATLC